MPSYLRQAQSCVDVGYLLCFRWEVQPLGIHCTLPCKTTLPFIFTGSKERPPEMAALLSRRRRALHSLSRGVLVCAKMPLSGQKSTPRTCVCNYVRLFWSVQEDLCLAGCICLPGSIATFSSTPVGCWILSQAKRCEPTCMPLTPSYGAGMTMRALYSALIDNQEGKSHSRLVVLARLRLPPNR